MDIQPDALIAAACQQTGLDDFGGESYREGLDLLCQSLAEEAQLNQIGQMGLPAAIVGALANRLRVTDWVKRNPGVADERIEAPFVVVGIFRAGTTLASYLLEKDARHRPLFRWEAGNSLPPPTPDTIATDPRIDATRAEMAMMDQINPRMRIVQSEQPDGPTECIAVMGQDFRSVIWEAMANLPTYGRWLAQADPTPAYAYYKRVLQVLQSGGLRGRWSLKSPHHAMHLEALTAIFPDARLVALHRDPVVLATSVCSLITTLTGTFSDADHRAYIADHWTDLLARSIDALDRFRAARPDKTIVDVRYADLAGDPIGTMKGVYAAFDDEPDAQALAAMQAHVAANPKGRAGRHGYDPADFGLDAGAIAERFRGYVERYDIPLETARQTA